MSKEVKVTAGDIMAKAKIHFNTFFLCWLIALISETWYVEYPFFVIAFSQLFMYVKLQSFAYDTISNAQKG